MERAVALKKLRKLLGDKLGYRVDPKALTKDERPSVQHEYNIERIALKTIQEQKDQRCREILAADEKYQMLAVARKDASERVDKLRSKLLGYKITVGTSTSMFFHVRAQGDSWEEVIDKLQQKQTA